MCCHVIRTQPEFSTKAWIVHEKCCASLWWSIWECTVFIPSVQKCSQDVMWVNAIFQIHGLSISWRQNRDHDNKLYSCKIFYFKYWQKSTHLRPHSWNIQSTCIIFWCITIILVFSRHPHDCVNSLFHLICFPLGGQGDLRSPHS